MEKPIVSIKQGKLLGKILNDLDDQPFYSFQGIPYAKPPIGPLRFKAPQEAEPWNGIRDATEEANGCVVRYSSNKTIGSEDCLYLNVYTRQLPSQTSSSKSVIVWIHGGSFTTGSSRTNVYGPEYLMTGDIILVTFNYRLGILGFLQLEDESLEVPGNAALKDMVMVLKWVQNNIQSFCGNPDNVTIAGQSSGGAAVHYLVLSPLAKKLFHKAIAQSGCALHSFARGRDDLVIYLAKTLNMSNATDKELLDNLNSMPIEKLLEISENVTKACEALNDAGLRLPYGPLIEKSHAQAFMVQEPIDIINSGNYNDVPMIFGYTNKEGMFLTTKVEPEDVSMPKDFQEVVPYSLNIKRDSEESKNVARKMKEFYYPKLFMKHKIENFYLFHGDNYFIRDIIFSAEYHAKTRKYPVYLYRMSVDTSLNIYKKRAKVTGAGVCHGDDISYLFKNKNSPPILKNSLEELSVKRFVTYWANFAKFENPNQPEMTEWKPIGKNTINFLDIGKELTNGVSPEDERIKFWKDIFKLNPAFNTLKCHL